ncbi:unnamed protein product [Arctogadus glacialis]
MLEVMRGSGLQLCPLGRPMSGPDDSTLVVLMRCSIVQPRDAGSPAMYQRLTASVEASSPVPAVERALTALWSGVCLVGNPVTSSQPALSLQRLLYSVLRHPSPRENTLYLCGHL